ncbi:hypothetical protein GCM10008940_02830 [Microbulbifer agarilyticus]
MDFVFGKDIELARRRYARVNEVDKFSGHTTPSNARYSVTVLFNAWGAGSHWMGGASRQEFYWSVSD